MTTPEFVERAPYVFSERLRHVLANATAEACRWEQPTVGTEHLVLALSRETDSAATAVLRHHLVNPTALIAHVDGVLHRPTVPTPPSQTRHYTTRSNQVLEHAMAEARALGNATVGTDHLLLGVLREAVGVGAQVLNAHGLTLDAARATVRQFGAVEPAPPPRGPTRAPTRAVARVMIDVQYADGGEARETFPTVTAALNFLAGH